MNREQSIATFKDYYEVLHLHPEADAAMVDQAYWHLARLYNAAIPSDGNARDMLDELNEAYSVLRSPGLRDEYDALRDAVLGEGALPAPRQVPAEPPPLSVMAKQKPKAKADSRQPAEGRRPERAKPRLRLSLGIRQIVVPNWQSAVTLGSMIVLAGAAMFAGAEPALVLTTLVVGVGFTVIPVVARMPRLPSIPKPQVALPAIGPPNVVDRLPREHLDTDKLRQSTEAMLARWRENTGNPPER